jgi:ATP-dependent helicase/nuclease subunit A
VYNPDEMTYRKPIAAAAISEAIKREMLAEEMRVLYVGMTRARERLILCGSTVWTDWMRDAGYSPPTDPDLLQAVSSLHWLIRGIPRDTEPRETDSDAEYGLPARYPWRIITHDSIETSQPASPVSVSITETTASQSTADVPTETAEPFFPRLPEIKLIPFKQSVSQRVREANVYNASLPERPRFIQSNDKPTAAESGIVLHTILAHTDIALMRVQPILSVLKETVARLLRVGIISDAQAQAIALQPLYLFYSSETGRGLIEAEEVRREWAFNLMDENKRTLVQGVIDCAYLTNDGWTLIDYKSDRASDTDALARRYAPQIRMYADALRRITGRPVSKRILYMLSYNKACVIDEREEN